MLAITSYHYVSRPNALLQFALSFEAPQTSPPPQQEEGPGVVGGSANPSINHP
jgi:hypothetical protein